MLLATPQKRQGNDWLRGPVCKVGGLGSCRSWFRALSPWMSARLVATPPGCRRNACMRIDQALTHLSEPTTLLLRLSDISSTTTTWHIDRYRFSSFLRLD